MIKALRAVLLWSLRFFHGVPEPLLTANGGPSPGALRALQLRMRDCKT
jgi:hypothetical protein